MTDRVAPGDHFSGVAASYAAYRPRYPRQLFEQLSAIAPNHRWAWDCAAGTGQATVDLADFFESTVGSDASAAQIARAPAHERIVWQVARAEASGIAPGMVDFIAVPQALHWFDLPVFFEEARRVATDGALLAAWSYGSAALDGELGVAYSRFEHETMGTYWPAERRYVVDVYGTIEFPFEQVSFPGMTMDAEWTRERLLGYMRTWSATTAYVARHGGDPVAGFAREIEPLWPDAEATRKITWPLAVRVGRIGKQ